VLQDSDAFSGFSVSDLAAAKDFYGQTLGLKVEDSPMGLRLQLGNGTGIFIYAKDDHQAAGFTILNFPVKDINSVVDDLTAAGVSFEQYDFGNGAKTDEKGVMRGLAAKQGPDIAWFKDPAGNILSVLQEAE
jgi:predicted enzyme related to lactoylglutathione lyase